MSKFRRRLMGLAALRQTAADDFVRVEYIENTSTAYIDTGIKGNNNIKIDAVILFNATVAQFVYGSRRGDTMTASGNYGYLFYTDGTSYFGTCVGTIVTKNFDYTPITNKKYHLNGTMRNLNIIFNDIDEETGEVVEKTLNIVNSGTTPASANDKNSYIFNINSKSGIAVNNALKGRVYSFKIYDGSTLVRDYIPMYQISTDTYGLWDRVEKKFYTSPNGVKFIGGHQIIYDAEIEYLQSNGTQQIDTLYVPKGYDNTIETKITYLGYSNTNSWLTWFSTYVDEETNTYRIIRNGNLDTQVLVYNGNKAGGGGLQVNVTVGTDYDLKLYPSYLLVNGTRYNFITLRGNKNTNTLQLFGGKGPKIRMWGFKLTKGTTVILDMIPVRKDGVGYMYDKVSGKLFGNNGSGSFILGQDTVVYDKI